MGTYTLPLRSDFPHYIFGVELEGKAYRFKFRWNARAGAWFFAVLTSDDQPLVFRRVVLGRALLERYKDARLPPGLLEALDTTGEQREAGLEDLGNRVVFIYTDSADVAAALALVA